MEERGMHIRLASPRWLAVPALALALSVSVSANAPSASAQSQCIQTYYGTSFNCGGYYNYYTSMPITLYGGSGYGLGGGYGVQTYPWYGGYWPSSGSYYPYSYTATMY